MNPFPRDDLERFVSAQQPVYDSVCAQLAQGRKTGHWMWFVFPQLRALGRSGTAHFFGIEDAAEARGYWRHLVLGPRLLHCTQLVLSIERRSAHQIFGSPDDLKLRSGMTLFESVAPGEPAFAQLLERYYAGERDPLTVTALRP